MSGTGIKDINIRNKSIPKDKLLQLLEAEVSKRSFYEFFKLSAPILYPGTFWDWNWHFEYISTILQEETERMLDGIPKNKDIIINLPFRSGKSIMVSVIFPVWLWIKNKNINIISVSATESLAVKFSHSSKMLIESKWFKDRFPDIQLRPDSKSKGAFINTSGGHREAFGINSLVIGSGCNVMLLDDLQSPDDISPLGLRNTIESFQDILFSRLDNPGVDFRILLQQRVHENDISGYLMRTNPDKYFNICLPVVITEDLNPKSLAHAYIDGYFWPQRFSKKILDDFKLSMRPNMYAGQLLQRPTLEEGEIIHRQWFKTIKLSQLLSQTSSVIKWSMVIDTAFTTDKKNDPTSIMICARVGNNLYIRKVYQRWLQFVELISNIRELQSEYGVQRIYIEEKGSGISIIQQLRTMTMLNVITLSPQGKDKLTRVNAITPILEASRVVLVEDLDWNDMFITECASFPYGTHDDMVDCLAYSVHEFMAKSGVTVFKSR
jgi:predicted phage terminase large subunit-like protein